MTLRSYQFSTLILLLTLFLTVPLFAEAASTFQQVLWSIVTGFFGLFLGLAALLLDLAVNDYVIGFGHEFITSGVGKAVNELWEVVRDIFNLTFIFGLVFIGLKMILNSDDSNTRRWLINLILAALLVNFSLFITKAVVDFSNITATQIAMSFPIETENRDNELDTDITLSTGFMNVLGLQQAFGVIPYGELGVPDDAAYGFIFGTMIIFIVMTFVFAAGGILLLIRYAALCLYMTLSPLMFLGWVFPQFQSVSSKYWQGFLGRAFFAPVYLLMVYFSLFMLSALYNTINFEGKGGLISDSLQGKGAEVINSFSGTLVPFILTCVFLIAAIVLANKLGADGASTAIKIGQDLRGKMQRTAGAMAGGASVGMVARGMRNTVGRGSEALTRNRRFKEFASSSTFGKYAFKTAQKGAQSSFDVRQVAGLGKATGLGTGVAGGYAKSVADKKKADKEFLKAIKTDFDEKDPATKAKMAQREEEIKEQARKEKERNLPALERNRAETERKRLEEQARFDDERKRLDYAISQLTTDLSGAASLTPTERAQKQQELKKNKDELAEREKDFKENDLKLRTIEIEIGNKIDDIESRLRNADKYAKAETKYANELAYMNKLERNVNFWNRAGTIVSGGLVGNQVGIVAGSAVAGAGTAATAGFGAAGLLMGAGTVNAFSDRANQSLTELRREYGLSGTIMMEKETKSRKMKDLAAAIAEENEAAKPPAEPKPEETT